ncbi:hypothetical protein HMPREF3213_02588 [Heyndrickxia coagulans]|uniref:Uncharacterized protein n=1 Tax=Heyndrickxia coagulans TaxID=1398 RepID=A0A0C5C7F1_HEYCO|nr:hypothetical protein SB48_HM08orf03143 [Heyndrickxia coagulans]KWZ79484.1 hypothetical protein HMPREF3213_02588 [Heyndrickxia coagulans]
MIFYRFSKSCCTGFAPVYFFKIFPYEETQDQKINPFSNNILG